MDASLASSFNEAAGIPRGRRWPGRRPPARQACASMRPRVFPAEDHADHLPVGGAGGASMRPRVFPAEDRRRPSAPRRAVRRLQ